MSRLLLTQSVATIRVMSRADAFIAKGGVFQGMGVSLMRMRCKLKLCGIPVSTIGVELSEAMRGIWPRA